MVDAARQALDFSVGRDRASLDTDAMYRRAVINCIQEIGEAAVRVSPEARALIPAVPWRQIVEMRNRLVHVYFNVNLHFVWEVINRDLRPLIDAVEITLA
jgi:uncharacterized protein with HEPN domain